MSFRTIQTDKLIARGSNGAIYTVLESTDKSGQTVYTTGTGHRLERIDEKTFKIISSGVELKLEEK